MISPDIMVCFGLNELPTRVYKLWVEHIVPSVIIEIASESTADNDMTTKLALYQRLGVEEYYIFATEHNCLREPLMAFRLFDLIYKRVTVENSRILSSALGLELVDTGETLRLFNPQPQEFLMTLEETQRVKDTIQAENERLREELARLKGEK